MSGALRLVPPEPLPGVQVDDECPDGLAGLIEAGHPILLIARWSGSSGRTAVRQVLQSLQVAVKALRATGLDVGHLVDPAALQLRLESTRATPYPDAAGRGTFDIRAVLEDRHRDRGLVLLVITGTGQKVDAGSFTQPTVQEVARAVSTYAPALVFASEMSRWVGRDPLLLGPLLWTLEHLQLPDGARPYLGGSDLPLRPYDEIEGLRLILVGQAGKVEAQNLKVRGGGGAVERTDEVMAEGRFQYASGMALPPGLAAVRVRKADGTPGLCLGYLDTPQCRPDPADALYGLAAAPGDPDRPSAGSQLPAEAPADQVANVIWFLEHYGTPGWSITACAAEL
ncbi:MAG TPA: hypothetical protein VFS29_04905 [Motilibacteraceae bacterium]|nr:hypothetical protein [Motilibacteraceae bacterium]